MDDSIKARALVIGVLLLTFWISSAEARMPDRLKFKNIGLKQTIWISFQVDQQDPTILLGLYQVFSPDSETPMISVQFTAKANESRNVQNCYVLVIYFTNNIIPYHRPQEIETTKWSLCLETTAEGTKKWQLKFPIVGRNYIINDISVYELELEQVDN